MATEDEIREAAAGEDPAAAEPAGERSIHVEGVAPEELAEEIAAEEVEQDLDQLQDPAAEAAAMRELAQRTQADFENFRKRARQNEQAAGDRATARLARELIGALDNFEHALAATAQRPDGDAVAEVARGFALIRDELIAGLGRCGVELDSPEPGVAFDPKVHEAIAHVPVEGAEPGTVVEVHQRGYLLGDTVIRAARVTVAAAAG